MLPQHQMALSTTRAHVWLALADNSMPPVMPLGLSTFPGAVAPLLVLPLPSWPESFCPQHHASGAPVVALVAEAQVYCAPAYTWVTGGSPVTWVTPTGSEAGSFT